MAQLIRVVGPPTAAVALWLVAAALLWRTSVPDGLSLRELDARSLFTERELERSRDYRRFLRADWIALVSAQLAGLWVLVRRAPALAARLPGGALARGLVLAVVALAVLWLVRLPFGLAALWWRRRHDISRLGYGDWFLDPWPTLVGEVAVTLAAVALAMTLATRLGRRWWLVGAPTFAALGAAVVLLQPLVLSPRLSPLRDRALAAEIRALARETGVGRVDVEVQNASRRTTVPNAEAIGIGPTKRVVLWDTLLDGRFARGEIRVIAAHELGHVAADHLWKGLAWLALFVIPGVYALARLVDVSRPERIPLAVLVAIVIQLAVLPAANAVSRRYEAEADWRALEAARDPGAARALFRHFVTASLADPEPPTLWHALLGTHPTVLQRLAMVEAWEARPTNRRAASRAGS